MEEKQPIVLRPLVNPLAEEFIWQYDGANYVLQPGEKKEFPDYITFLGAKKIADKLAKTASEEERQVLQRAVLEEREPEVVAKEMGIKWDKVLEAKKMAELKGKESARVINLEQQVADLTKTVKELQENKIEETSLEEENPKVEGKTYSCEQCGETFDTPLAKARHIRLSHK